MESGHVGHDVLPIFYDNAYAADIAAARACPKQPSCIADSLQHIMYKLAVRVTPAFFHVSSHTGVYYNEFVDSLAKAGAGGNISMCMPSGGRTRGSECEDFEDVNDAVLIFKYANPLPWTAF
eukprot:5524056-Karenia_brevis.AAC.1